jgi:hypothetical protein
MLPGVERKTPLATRPVFGGYPARVVEDRVDVEGLQEEGEEVREVPTVTRLHEGTGETRKTGVAASGVGAVRV